MSIKNQKNKDHESVKVISCPVGFEEVIPNVLYLKYVSKELDIVRLYYTELAFKNYFSIGCYENLTRDELEEKHFILSQYKINNKDKDSTVPLYMGGIVKNYSGYELLIKTLTECVSWRKVISYIDFTSSLIFLNLDKVKEILKVFSILKQSLSKDTEKGKDYRNYYNLMLSFTSNVLLNSKIDLTGTFLSYTNSDNEYVKNSTIHKNTIDISNTLFINTVFNLNNYDLTPQENRRTNIHMFKAVLERTHINGKDLIGGTWQGGEYINGFKHALSIIDSTIIDTNINMQTGLIHIMSSNVYQSTIDNNCYITSSCVKSALIKNTVIENKMYLKQCLLNLSEPEIPEHGGTDRYVSFDLNMIKSIFMDVTNIGFIYFDGINTTVKRYSDNKIRITEDNCYTREINFDNINDENFSVTNSNIAPNGSLLNKLYKKFIKFFMNKTLL